MWHLCTTIQHHSETGIWSNTLNFKLLFSEFFLIGSKFQAKTPSRSKVFTQGERQKLSYKVKKYKVDSETLMCKCGKIPIKIANILLKRKKYNHNVIND